jgi:hypothetical protein
MRARTVSHIRQEGSRGREMKKQSAVIRFHDFPELRSPVPAKVYTEQDLQRFRARLYGSMSHINARIERNMKKSVQSVSSLGICVPCLHRDGNEVAATRLIAGEPWCQTCAGGGR